MAKEKRKAKRMGWLYAVGQFLLRLFYVPVYRIRVIGRENVPKEGPVLLCSNHVTMKDPVILGIAQRRQVFYMAKEELFQNGFIGGVLRGLGAFPVKRGTGGTDALEDAYALLEENAVVGVFIEGTRSKTGELQRPKTGAALLHYRTKAPVVPVCITGSEGGRPLPFRRTEIRFGKPIPAEELAIPDESSMQLRKASRVVMERIAALRADSREALGLPAPQPEAKEEG
ncbi:lysophospholipid acyltransferase family protein [Neglectibacter caecimuris]|uniref:lysophospholipid acyltransferase family protein n=1 Tax=Neglectibacter caecimuris TaxID=3093658 RepID=UPI002AC9D412|nr:lysophospholipid acyltransferase family protein [Neglectibacter sp. M00184]